MVGGIEFAHRDLVVNTASFCSYACLNRNQVIDCGHLIGPPRVLLSEPASTSASIYPRIVGGLALLDFPLLFQRWMQGWADDCEMAGKQKQGRGSYLRYWVVHIPLLWPSSETGVWGIVEPEFRDETACDSPTRSRVEVSGQRLRQNSRRGADAWVA